MSGLCDRDFDRRDSVQCNNCSSSLKLGEPHILGSKISSEAASVEREVGVSRIHSDIVVAR